MNKNLHKAKNAKNDEFYTRYLFYQHFKKPYSFSDQVVHISEHDAPFFEVLSKDRATTEKIFCNQEESNFNNFNNFDW